MQTDALAAILAVVMDEVDRSGETHRRVLSRLRRLAEAEGGINPEVRMALAEVASGLETRDAARERREVV